MEACKNTCVVEHNPLCPNSQSTFAEVYSLRFLTSYHCVMSVPVHQTLKQAYSDTVNSDDQTNLHPVSPQAVPSVM